MNKPLSVEYRWENCVPHRKESEELYDFIAKLDFETGDELMLKSGGDGDNGETLMFLMDSYFDSLDGK